MALTHLTSDTFDQAVNAGDDLVVVDFFATWDLVFSSCFVIY